MEVKHSGVGIASFVTSIVAGVLIFLLVIIAGVLEVSTPGGMDEESIAAVLIGLFLFAFLGAELVALGLGIGGLIQKDRKKIFAILGVVFSATALLITLLFSSSGWPWAEIHTSLRTNGGHSGIPRNERKGSPCLVYSSGVSPLSFTSDGRVPRCLLIS